jgi:2,4-dienoyl-CoA reductase-like NADH-dependent reductase (Old Yellow Enzyme family)
MSTRDLLSPFSFRNGARAPNRVALAPMTNSQSHADGSLGDDELRWLMRRAEGGFGIVATCAAHVTTDGQAWAGELGIFDDALLPGLTRLASALRGAGALSMVQLFHGGARTDAKLTGGRPWSASEIPGDAGEPRAATAADIARVIAAFRDAAVRAHRAGFDGIELHGAHGYLLCQFLSALNVRTDGWGGASFAARARLLREVTRAVRAAVPASFLVGVRISPEDFGNARGLDLDESLTLAGWLADDGIDFLHLSLWTAANNTKKRPDAHPVPLFRRACPAGVALFVAGKVWTRAEADALLERGADVVALGRSAIANPDWPARAADPGWEPRRPPLTPAELVERGLSAPFAQYMRNWKGFVTE